MEPTVSKIDSVPAVRPTEKFTAVPNDLLRSAGLFTEPIDFMIYLFLYSYSVGFGKPTASASQAQLEALTGAVKNTVKRALERLEAQGRIKQIGEYKHSRIARTWQVFVAPDTVKNEQCQAVTQTGLKNDSLTVSKIDPYKERRKEILKNSLSGESLIENYLAAVKPERKRESERRAAEALLGDYSSEQIAECTQHLRRFGVPGSGEPCHSPLAYLAKAMPQVLAAVTAARQKVNKAAEAAQVAELKSQQERKKLEQEERDAHQRETAFVAAYPESAAQTAVISSYAKQFPVLSATGSVLRSLAISAWWAEGNPDATRVPMGTRAQPMATNRWEPASQT